MKVKVRQLDEAASFRAASPRARSADATGAAPYTERPGARRKTISLIKIIMTIVGRPASKRHHRRESSSSSSSSSSAPLVRFASSSINPLPLLLPLVVVVEGQKGTWECKVRVGHDAQGTCSSKRVSANRAGARVIYATCN